MRHYDRDHQQNMDQPPWCKQWRIQEPTEQTKSRNGPKHLLSAPYLVTRVVAQGLRRLPQTTGSQQWIGTRLLRGQVQLWHRGMALEILARDAELAHHGVQGGPVQSETGGGRGDHPAALPKHADDMLPLHLLERGAAGDFRRILPSIRPKERAGSGRWKG